MCSYQAWGVYTPIAVVGGIVWHNVAQFQVVAVASDGEK
jgi:hypothetical protein